MTLAVIIPEGTKLDLSMFKRYVDIWGHMTHVLTTNRSIAHDSDTQVWQAEFESAQTPLFHFRNVHAIQLSAFLLITSHTCYT